MAIPQSLISELNQSNRKLAAAAVPLAEIRQMKTL
jgi:hypothetical protein